MMPHLVAPNFGTTFNQSQSISKRGVENRHDIPAADGTNGNWINRRERQHSRKGPGGRKEMPEMNTDRIGTDDARSVNNVA